jgi:hypothetical protein
MPINKPITSNVLYNIGQQGYAQTAGQSIPDYLRQTIPVPSVLKEQMGFLPEDFRVDASNINPFGTANNIVSSFYAAITGDYTGGATVFQFANPYLNELIKDRLGVDPVSGRIDWSRVNQNSNNGEGMLSATKNMFEKIGGSTVIGSTGKIMDAVDNAYAADGLANQYPAIQSADDALKIMEGMYTTDAQGNRISQGMEGWSLKIPNEVLTEPSGRSMDIINALGFKSYDLNMNSLNDQSSKEHVAAMALAFYNNKKMADAAVSDLNSTNNWVTKSKYVTEVWVPAARSQGIDEATIQVVLMKLQMEKPKGGKAIDPNLLLATMGVE